MSKIVGITGTIGSGKSTVGELLGEEGVPVIDTDHIVHELLSDPNPVRDAVVARFGTEIQRPSGEIDRTKLGYVVFQDAAARHDLEEIVHPAVRQETARRAASYTDAPVVACLVPLLFETGFTSRFDEIWTVTTDESTLRQRLAVRDQLDPKQIELRLAAQMPQEEKAAGAHRVIDNSGSIENTRTQIQQALKAIKSLA